MKAFTDINQSKKLAEILPIESADMCYPLPYEEGDKPLLEQGGFGSTPCWSLAALLNVLPKQFGQNTITLYWFKNAWHCDYANEDFESEVSMSANNPVDACFEMVFELKRLIDNNLLEL